MSSRTPYLDYAETCFLNAHIVQPKHWKDNWMKAMWLHLLWAAEAKEIVASDKQIAEAARELRRGEVMSDPKDSKNVIEQLLQAIRTASNDDLSEPMSEKRSRHVQRIEAMHAAIDEIERLRAAHPAKPSSVRLAHLQVGPTIARHGERK